MDGYCDITIVSCLVNCSDDIRGNHYKLYKRSCTIDATKYYFTDRIVNVCNSLPNCVVTAPACHVFLAGYLRLIGAHIVHTNVFNGFS